MNIQESSDPQAWDTFLNAMSASPFLQSWTMGDVYTKIGQQPIRLELVENGEIQGVCLAIVVPARRGRHLMVQYGPVLLRADDVPIFVDALKEYAHTQKCGLIRMSPFWTSESRKATVLSGVEGAKSAPLHLLAEHVWHLPLTERSAWSTEDPGTARTQDELFGALRKTTRNLVRRAEKEGVTIRRSNTIESDFPIFLALHEETRKRHHFTPYTNAFFRAQTTLFHPKHECTLYLAEYQDEVIAASVHMHNGGETSYHHGASTHRHSKIPASYLLQWTAICDALARGDHTYNFWGIAPVHDVDGKLRVINPKHPFAGVTTFKMGFGGEILELQHCTDIPVSPSYKITRTFEQLRKWKRGF